MGDVVPKLQTEKLANPDCDKYFHHWFCLLRYQPHFSNPISNFTAL